MSREDLVPAILSKGFVVINKSSVKIWLTIHPKCKIHSIKTASQFELNFANTLVRNGDVESLDDLVILREE